MTGDDGLHRTRRALPPPHPRPAPRRRALGDRPRRAPRPQPARRLQAPQGAARGGARRGAPRGKAALVRTARAAPRRGRRVARALPRALDRTSRRPGTPPGGEPLMNGTLETHADGRPALRFERRLPHSVDRVWRAVSDPAEMKQWFVATVDWTPAVGETIEA